jgi:hypothetical protein
MLAELAFKVRSARAQTTIIIAYSILQNGLQALFMRTASASPVCQASSYFQ